MSLGRQRVLVAEVALSDLPIYREGLTQKIAHMGHEVKEEYSQVTEELRSLAQRAQVTTQQTATQLKQLAEQAKERAQALAEQALDKADELNEQFRENTQTVRHQAQTTGSVWLQDWQERAAALREDLQAGTAAFTVQAQDIFDAVVEEALDAPVAQAAPPVNDGEEDFFDALFADVEPPKPPRAAEGQARSPQVDPMPPPATVRAEATVAPVDDDPWNLDEGPEPAPLAPPIQTIPVEAWDVDDDADPWDGTTPITATPIAPSDVSGARSPNPNAPSTLVDASSEEDEPWI